MKIGRREFLRLGTGAVAASAIASKKLLASTSLWQQATTGEAIRFASIGTGVRGCELLGAALKTGGVCVGVSDLYEGRLRAGREVAQTDIVTTSEYRELLDRKDVQAVIVAVPDHLHRRIATDAFAAGKDVYCEKPLSHNVADGFEILAAAQKHDRILQVGSQRVSSVLYAKAREIF